MNVTTLPRIGFDLAFITFIAFSLVYRGILRSVNQVESLLPHLLSIGQRFAHASSAMQAFIEESVLADSYSITQVRLLPSHINLFQNTLSWQHLIRQ